MPDSDPQPSTPSASSAPAATDAAGEAALPSPTPPPMPSAHESAGAQPAAGEVAYVAARTAAAQASQPANTETAASDQQAHEHEHEQERAVIAEEASSEDADESAAGEGVEEEDEGGEREGFWHAMAERTIHMRSMPWSLRLITGFALGQLVAVALLLALRDHALLGLPAIEVGTQDHQRTLMSLGIFVICLLFLGVAWVFVLTGAIHAPWVVRVLVLGIASFIFSYTPSPVAGLHAALLVVLWLWALGVGLVAWREADRRGERSRLAVALVARVPWLRRPASPLRAAARHLADALLALRRHVALPAGTRLPVRTLAFVALWLLVYYGSLLASVGFGQGSAFFATSVTLQIEALSFCLVPVLFLAGTDYAEVGEVLAGRLARLARAIPSVWPLFALTSVTAGLILWQELPEGAHSAGAEITSLASQLFIGGLLFVALALVARWGRVAALPRRPLPYVALVAGTLLFVALGVAVGQVAITHQATPRLLGPGDYAVYVHSAPDFSFVYPKTWTASNDDDPLHGETAVVFSGLKSQYVGALTVISYPASEGDQNAALEATFCPASQCAMSSPVAHGAWGEIAFTRGKARGWFWVRRAGQRMYFVDAFVPAFMAVAFKTSLDAVVDSWRPDHQAAVPPEPGLSAQQIVSLVQLLQGVMAVLALLGGLALLWLGRRRRSYVVTASGAFVTVLGILWLVFELAPLAQLAGLPAAHLAFSLPSLQLAVAAATLLLLSWLLARRRLGARQRELLALVFALNAGLQFVAWIIAAFDQSLGVTLSVAQAIILVIGIGWDVLMSGEQITNPDGRRFPRQVRLLLYLGYTMLVTTAVLYFTMQRVPGGGGEPFFEDARWPQLGLIFLGAPLVLTVFVVEVSRWRRAL